MREARIKSAHDLARRYNTGQERKGARLRGRQHVIAETGAYDEPCARIARLIEIARIEHRACADHRVGQRARNRFDGGKRLRRAQCYLEHAQAAFVQRADHRHCILGALDREHRDDW